MNPARETVRPADLTVPALEIGGTHVTAAVVDLQAGVLRAGSVERATLDPSGPADEVLDAIIGCGQRLTVGPGQCWGVAIPGPFDYEHGIGLFAGVAKFEGLYGIDIRQALAAGLPGPPGPILFVNDADAFLWGEWLFGAAAGHERCVAVTLGTGIGSAFVADGQIRHSGPGVPPEGRVDLLQISGLPLEEVVSARAIERAYRQRTGITPAGTEYVARQARHGDQAAAAVLRTSFERLGTALRPWLEEFGATTLVVGGSMTGSWDLIGPAMLRGLQGEDGASLKGLTASVAARPEQAALLGAAAYAQRKKGSPNGPWPGGTRLAR